MSIRKAYTLNYETLINNVLQLALYYGVEIEEKNLRQKLNRKASTPSPKPSKFLQWMLNHCLKGIANSENNGIQVYMEKTCDNLENNYLSTPHFTTGLNHVPLGYKHIIRNHNPNQAMFVFKCNPNSKKKYFDLVNKYKLPLDNSSIRNDFEIQNYEQTIILDADLIYFFYTFTYSHFDLQVLPNFSVKTEIKPSIPTIKPESSPESSLTSNTTKPVTQLTSNTTKNLPNTSQVPSDSKLNEKPDIITIPDDQPVFENVNKIIAKDCELNKIKEEQLTKTRNECKNFVNEENVDKVKQVEKQNDKLNKTNCDLKKMYNKSLEEVKFLTEQLEIKNRELLRISKSMDEQKEKTLKVEKDNEDLKQQLVTLKLNELGENEEKINLKRKLSCSEEKTKKLRGTINDAIAFLNLNLV